MRIFDTHAHYDDHQFDEDRDVLLEGALQAGGISNIANIGCNMKSSKQSVEFTEKYDYIYAVIGVIPHHVDEMTDESLDELRMDFLSEKGIPCADYYYVNSIEEFNKAAENLGYPGKKICQCKKENWFIFVLFCIVHLTSSISFLSIML